MGVPSRQEDLRSNQRQSIVKSDAECCDQAERNSVGVYKTYNTRLCRKNLVHRCINFYPRQTDETEKVATRYPMP